MGFIAWIIIGLIAGYIAEKATGANHGLLTNLVVGIVGAFIGGFLARALGVHFFGFAGSLLVATGGAILLLYLLRLFRQRA